MNDPIKYKKDAISEELEDVVANARDMAEEMGLEPRNVSYWVVDQDDINELASYGGFQNRYPHWRWGMMYDQRRKKSEYTRGKIFEMVINDSPCHAYLQMSNSIADQKSVITHVEGHSDFFAQNEWFQDDPDASEMLDRHAERIRNIVNDPDVDREEVEEWIDNILCIEDTIDQHGRDVVFNPESKKEKDDVELDLDIDEKIQEMVFGDEEIDPKATPKSIEESYIDGTVSDVIGFLMENGQRYGKGSGRAEPYEDWQQEIIEMIREEAYYFAPQKMTKVMNEGWAKYIENFMMTYEGMADVEDIIDYADHSSGVLNSPGFNPYSLGLALWEHVENTVNRREVVDKLLRVKGVNVENYHDSLDFQEIHDCIEECKGDDIIERNYSLTRLKNRGFLQAIPVDNLHKCDRYIIDSDQYSSVEEAIADVDFSRGWERMKEIRETHNDPMFIDEFLTQEFVDDQQFYTYEYRAAHKQMEIASRDVEDVRKKLLLQLTNFGKPTIEVASDNYDNAGELLLLHRYNGIEMNIAKVEKVLERIFEMWGRPVNVATIRKSVTESELDYAMQEEIEPEIVENPIRIRYDGNEYQEYELEETIAEDIKSDDVNYNTRAGEWYE